jgi:hypothetical protein
VPERYGHPMTVSNRLNRSRKTGVRHRLMHKRTRLYDNDVRMIEASLVRIYRQGGTTKREATSKEAPS